MMRRIGMFAISAFLTAVTLSASVPLITGTDAVARGNAREYANKEDQFFRWIEAEAVSDYVLLFGPSTTVFGIIPNELDAVLAGSGFPLRSYNLGMSGANLHEVDYYVRRTLGEIERRGMAKPRWVVIDLALSGTFGTLADNQENIDRILSPRSEEWHDGYQSRAVIRTILRDGEADLRLKAASVGLHSWVSTKRFFRKKLWTRPTPVGLLQTVRTEKRLREEWRDRMPVDPHRGYERLAEDGKIGELRQEYLASLPEGYAALLESKRRSLQDPAAPVERFNYEALREQVDHLRGRGIEPFYIVSPICLETRHARALSTEKVLPRFVAYDNPDDFPEYFEVNSRNEKYHLSNEAAPGFSRRLAEDLARAMEPEAGPGSRGDVAHHPPAPGGTAGGA